MIDMTGKEIGRYQFRERLGAGGMAMVYKAYDTRLEREVAIKIIQSDVFAPNVLQEVLQRFEREAKALARLNHPHIVKVYDFGDFDGLPYLVMEYHSGGTVKRFTNHAHPYYDCARLIAPVARALEYAHQRGILHRDVKPSNILLNENHQPLLTDFGIAKILEMSASTGLTASGVGIGTPEYIAPEQGVGSGADPRSDIYSLGIVFYELITGKRPYSADTPMGVILAHVTKPLPNPREYVPDLPDHVINVLYQALAKEPADRFADMGAFASALEQLAAERPAQSAMRAGAAATGDATSMQPITGRIPTPYPSTMAPPSNPSGVSTLAGTEPGISRPVSQPAAQADSMRNKDVQAGAPDVGQAVSLSKAQNYNAVLPTVQASVPTQYQNMAPGQAEGLSRRQLRQQQAQLAGQARPTQAPDAGQAGSLSKAQSDSMRYKGRQARPKNSSTNWIIIGVMAVAAVALVAVAIGMVLKDGGTPVVPTQPVQAGGAEMASATALALAAAANLPADTLEPVATITPLPSPTPLPQFISDQFDNALALIPPGEFTMGSANEDPSASDSEKPQHSVVLESFYIDVHETRNTDYAQCVAAGQCLPPANFGSSTAGSYYDNPEFANYPVIHVSWQAAADYCKWRGGRLPTEAEWEYAARGGLIGQPYSWGDQQPTCDSQTPNGANSSQCPYSAPVPVAGFGNNNFGLYDMAGNVWEWTSSLSRPYPYNPEDGREDPVPVEQRILRGGSWSSEATSLRSAARRALNQNAVDNSVGFRCVVDLEIVTGVVEVDPGPQQTAVAAATAGFTAVADLPVTNTPKPTYVFRPFLPTLVFLLPTPTPPLLLLQTPIFILPSRTPTPTPTIGLIIIKPTIIFILPSPTPTPPPLIIKTPIFILPSPTPQPTLPPIIIVPITPIFILPSPTPTLATIIILPPPRILPTATPSR